ncbi:LysR family transcriptional regulator [[Clostridium] innocuum]|nr:LysR family transcriptional regulator [[Clostridium] innocuum]
MENKVFITVDEVAQQVNVSKSFAYKIIRTLNNELKAKGYITIAGRVSRKFFEERIYGMSNVLGGVENGNLRK